MNENIVTKISNKHFMNYGTVGWVFNDCKLQVPSVYYNYAIRGRPSQLLLSSECTCVSMVAVPTGYKNSYIRREGRMAFIVNFECV